MNTDMVKNHPMPLKLLFVETITSLVNVEVLQENKVYNTVSLIKEIIEQFIIVYEVKKECKYKNSKLMPTARGVTDSY